MVKSKIEEPISSGVATPYIQRSYGQQESRLSLNPFPSLFGKPIRLTTEYRYKDKEGNDYWLPKKLFPDLEPVHEITEEVRTLGG